MFSLLRNGCPSKKCNFSGWISLFSSFKIYVYKLLSSKSLNEPFSFKKLKYYCNFVQHQSFRIFLFCQIFQHCNYKLFIFSKCHNSCCEDVTEGGGWCQQHYTNSFLPSSEVKSWSCTLTQNKEFVCVCNLQYRMSNFSKKHHVNVMNHHRMCCSKSQLPSHSENFFWSFEANSSTHEELSEKWGNK